MRGTLFLYQGEELGLEDAVVPASQVLDPGGRDGCRAPIPWDADPPHGWPGAAPWLPFPPEPGIRSVERLRADPDSILHLYRRLMTLRRDHAALREGDLVLLETPDGVLGYERSTPASRLRVLVNFTGTPVYVPDGGGNVLVSSLDRDPEPRFAGRLAADEAVVITER